MAGVIRGIPVDIYFRIRLFIIPSQINELPRKEWRKAHSLCAQSIKNIKVVVLRMPAHERPAGLSGRPHGRFMA